MRAPPQQQATRLRWARATGAALAAAAVTLAALTWVEPLPAPGPSTAPPAPAAVELPPGIVAQRLPPGAMHTPAPPPPRPVRAKRKAPRDACPRLPAPRRRLLLYGDSLTAGGYFDAQQGRLRFQPYGPAMERALRTESMLAGDPTPDQWHLVHKGYPGASTADLLAHLPKLFSSVGAEGWDGMVLLAGTNDVLYKHKDSPQAVAGRIFAIAAAAKKAGVPWVVHLQIPLIDDEFRSGPIVARKASYCSMRAPGRGRRRGERVSELNSELLRRGGPCRVLDPFQLLPRHNLRLWQDCVHPSAEGYEAMGEAVAKVLLPRLMDVAQWEGDLRSKR